VRNFIPHFKWVVARDQLEHHEAQAVPVYTIPVCILHYHFRSQVLSGTNKALSHIIVLFAKTLFAQTEICESYVTLAVN